MRLKDTGLTAQELKDMVNKYMVETYERYDFIAERAEGMYLYDEEGNARVTPKKTTFDLKETAKEDVKYYAPDAELSKNEDADNLYGVSGNVEILFNYTTQEEKDWFDTIADEGALALLSNDESLSTLNDQLAYTKDTTEHGGNVVGRITIPLGQSNF